MAVGDQSSCCVHHQNTKVALFCQTCEELICTKCISKGPNSSARHHDHMYLDLNEAYDIQREEFEKVIARFREQLQTRKNERKALQTTVQKLKFEVLRRKTDVGRRVKSLKDSVCKNESAFMKRLSKVVQPAVQRVEDRFNEVEYDVVSREGLLGTSDSIQALSPQKGIPYLRMVVPTKRDMKSIYGRGDTTDVGSLSELDELHKVSLSLSRVMTNISQSFSVAEKDPSPPRLLPKWCTVGVNSTHLTWKFAVSDVPQHFYIYYRQLGLTRRKNTYHGPEKMSFSSIYSELGYTRIKINKFTQKRTSAMMQGLKAGTPYEVKLTTSNTYGESAPTTWHFVTSPRKQRLGVIQKRDPRTCHICATLFRWCVWSVLLCIILSYAALSLYLLYTNYEDLVAAGCGFIRESYLENEWVNEEEFMEYTGVVCPSTLVVPEPVFHPPDEEGASGLGGLGGRLFDWLASQD